MAVLVRNGARSKHASLRRELQRDGIRIDTLNGTESAVGFFCSGMNKNDRIVIEGNAGQGVGENMMSGTIQVKGDASQSAGATGRGGPSCDRG